MRVFRTKLHKATIAVLCALTVSAFSTTVSADEALCLQAVEEKRYERVSTVCLDLPHRNRLMKMQRLMSGDYEHFLGTVEKPSAAFQLLKAHAEDNDMQAMYMYGLLYSTVHGATDMSWPDHAANDGTQSLEDYNAAIHGEAVIWTRKAAERGHGLAMLDVAESMLRESFTNNSVDLNEALAFAAQAKQSNTLLAENLIERIKARIKTLPKK